MIAAAASSGLAAAAALLLLLLALLVRNRRRAAAARPDTAGTAVPVRGPRRRRRRALEEDITRLNRELQTVYNDVNGLRKTHAAMEEALRQLRTDLTALEAARNREGRLVDQLQDRHHKQLDQLRASVAAQQQLVGALDALLVGTSLAQDIV